eukprot:6792287-Pyramimonas_sp.AAC.1
MSSQCHRNVICDDACDDASSPPIPPSPGAPPPPPPTRAPPTSFVIFAAFLLARLRDSPRDWGLPPPDATSADSPFEEDDEGAEDVEGEGGAEE